jgi:hypothetical protein
MLSPAEALAIRSIAMRRPFLDRPVSILGQTLPMAPLLLVAFVVLGSALLAFLQRSGIPAVTTAALFPGLTLQGQIWRLLTWAFFEMNGLNLVLGAVLLGLVGRDLAGLWGGSRYLLGCIALSVAAGTLTSLVGLAWKDVGTMGYLNIWALADALLIAWSLLFPNRTILFMFVLPAAGRNLLYLTVGITVLFAIMDGFFLYVPHFLAMGLMYAYIRGGTALAAQLKLNRLLAPKRGNPGLRVVDGGKNPNGSGWVH